MFMGFSRQKYWGGLLLPLPGDLPDPRIEPTSSVSPALAGEFFTTESPGKPKKNRGSERVSNSPKAIQWGNPEPDFELDSDPPYCELPLPEVLKLPK